MFRIRLAFGLAVCLLFATRGASPSGNEDLLEDEFALLEEEDVVLAPARHKQRIGLSPSAVIVITRKDIEESGATDLLDLLRQYPALHVVTITPGHNLVNVRGAYRLLLLLDGREINLEVFPAPFFEALNVGLYDIDRIEIVLGPNSALYGANAVAAVINIMTCKPGHTPGADVSVRAGQNGAVLVDGRLESGLGPFELQATAGVNREHSWVDRHAMPRDLARATGALRWQSGVFDLHLRGGAIGGKLTMFSDAMGGMPMRDILIAHAQADFRWGDLKTRAYWYGLRGNVDIEIDLNHPDLGLTLGTLPTLGVQGDTFHLEAQYDLRLFQDNLLIAGVDLRHIVYRSEQLVEPVATESRLGIFMLDEHRFGNWLQLTAGLRLDANSITGLTFSPQFAAVFHPAADHFLRLSGGSAFRKPTLIETSANFKIEHHPAFPEIGTLFEQDGISNPDLNNELLSTVELGYQGSFLDRALRIDLNAYFAYLQDVIELSMDIRFLSQMQIDLAATDIGYFNSRTPQASLGCDMQIAGDPIEAVSLFLRAGVRRDWIIRDGSWHEWRDQIQAAAGVTLRMPAGIAAHLAGVYVGASQGDILRHPDSVLFPSALADVPAHTLLLASLAHTLPLGTTHLRLGVSFFNPFGARFRQKLGVTTLRGDNHGGEPLGSRLMFTARLVL